MSVEIRLSAPRAVRGKKGLELRVSFVVSESAHALLLGPDAAADLELFAKPLRPKPRSVIPIAKKPKGAHGPYWETLFHRGLQHCPSLKSVLDLEGEIAIEQ